MKCRNCEADGLTFERLDETRLPAVDGKVERFYDGAGKLHVHDHSVYRTQYQCSNGHTYVLEGGSSCPQPGCPFGREPKPAS